MIIFCIILLATSLYAKDAPNVGHLAMCSGVKQCLNHDLPQCSAEEKKPNPNIKYNAEFCAPYIELRERGLQTNNPRARDLYRYMGRQYRITYKIDGTLPVSKETMIYLFDNMEFTAQLVNAYRKTKYTIKYDTPDKKNFSGDNGGHMQGRFVWLLTDSAGTNPGMHHVFFGWGRTKIVTTYFSGTATAILDLKEVGKDSVAYEFRAIVSPSGPAMNIALNLFSGVIRGMIRDIITDIEKAASEFAKGNHKPIESYAPFKDRKWRKNLQEFEEVTKK
ncbi:MAG: hypothetical protein FWH22_06020 [Fibromonadales bacterium]|nr:hypothetical protein [Fibromonadales bacterium]